jgi:enoyl-CoA hydratase/carnithine racemase
MISDQNFTIGQLEIILGIVPGGGGNSRLPRLIGKTKALELMLNGGLWTPEEAKRNNLITDCFPKNEFHAKVQEFSDRMSRYSPVAVDEIKKTVHRGMDSTLLHNLSIEMGASIKCFDDETTQKTLEEYDRLLKNKVEVPKEKRSTIQDIVAEMTGDEMRRRIAK